MQILAQEVTALKVMMEGPTTVQVLKTPKVLEIPQRESQALGRRASTFGGEREMVNARVGSLADRLSELERRPDYSYLEEGQSELERKVRNLTESLNMVMTLQREQASVRLAGVEPTQPSIPVLDLPAIKEDLSQPGTDSRSDRRSKTSAASINELLVNFGEINLKLKTFTTKEEFNSFIDSVHSRFRSEEMRIREPAKHPDEDSTHRVSELEQRIQGAAKGLCDLQEDFKHLKQSSSHQLQTLKSSLEARVEDLKAATPALERKILVKLEDFGETCERRTQGCVQEDEISVLRATVLKMRTEMQVMRELQEALEANKPDDRVAMAPDANLDQITDTPELMGVKSVLQQHDQAIKYLSAKLTGLAVPVQEESALKHQEIAQALHRLDELKQEVMDMLAKQESSKSLSQKDYDLLNEIYSMMDNKISRDELVQKVDKEELTRMFKVLKRKTDGLYEYLRKNEQVQSQPAREDAYFLRKRLDKDCAACGQTLPESTEVGSSAYLSWGRFPARPPTLGPGFSRILYSLVVSADGSMKLPEKASPRLATEEDLATSLSAKGGKKGSRADLSMESGVRPRASLTRLPAVGRSKGS